MGISPERNRRSHNSHAVQEDGIIGLSRTDRNDIDAWRDMLKTLARDDWSIRVRISAGNRDGARIGNVANMPPTGLKLALKGALTARARAEIRAITVYQELRAYQASSRLRCWGWFVAGSVCVSLVALILHMSILLFNGSLF